MSFFEDFIAGGSHCSSCMGFIGQDCGFIRICRSCSGETKSNKPNNRNKKSMKKNRHPKPSKQPLEVR